ncbi:MAG: hypothetical protein LBC74_07875 [Planctomycetaceae bacterium]|jgi:hypothetical protein|nr:hypothetical protein [Planctomycetaceae bacterium]
MNKLLMNTVISALVGGIVGAAVVFFLSGKKFDKLEVRDLTITGQATALSADKKPEILIKNGSILVNNVIGGTRVVGTQVQGHVFVANRMLTSPDDLVRNINTQWKFYTEIGSSREHGGEIIVRSASGAISGSRLENLPTSGWMLRAGYIDADRPDISFHSNLTKEVMPVGIYRRKAEVDVGAGKTASNVAAATPNPAGTITTPNNKIVTANPTIPTNPPLNNPINSTTVNTGNVTAPNINPLNNMPKQDMSSLPTNTTPK